MLLLVLLLLLLLLNWFLCHTVISGWCSEWLSARDSRWVFEHHWAACSVSRAALMYGAVQLSRCRQSSEIKVQRSLFSQLQVTRSSSSSSIRPTWLRRIAVTSPPLALALSDLLDRDQVSHDTIASNVTCGIWRTISSCAAIKTSPARTICRHQPMPLAFTTLSPSSSHARWSYRNYKGLLTIWWWLTMIDNAPCRPSVVCDALSFIWWCVCYCDDRSIELFPLFVHCESFGSLIFRPVKFCIARYP